MRALFLVVLVALPSFAQEPAADAPVDSFAQPFCLEPQERINLAKKLVSLEAENAHLRNTVTMSLPIWVPIVVGALALGAGVGVGYGISRSLK